MSEKEEGEEENSPPRKTAVIKTTDEHDQDERTEKIENEFVEQYLQAILICQTEISIEVKEKCVSLLRALDAEGKRAGKKGSIDIYALPFGTTEMPKRKVQQKVN